jgi:flagellar hook-associated protein 1
MSTLSSVLSTALTSLSNAQGALTVTSDNISNVNTPGYARRRANLVEQTPIVEQGVTYGRGAVLKSIEALRDDTLELRMHAEAQRDGAAQARVQGLQPLDAVFSDIDNGLSSKLADYFDSITQLQTDPANVSLRESVLTAASNVASVFKSRAQELSRMRTNLDYDVTQSVANVNNLADEIAHLNIEVSRARAGGGNAPALEDQRTQAIRRLSELADVAIMPSDDGYTLTTSTGTPLVVGAQSYALTTQAGPDGHLHVFSGKHDATVEFHAGALGAQIDTRDNMIFGVLDDLDRVAAGFVQGTNAAHTGGFDLNGDPGHDLFAAVAGDEAATIDVAFTDARKLAAASNRDPGSNGNLAAIGALSASPLVDGQSAPDFVAALTFRIGSATNGAQAQADAGELIMKQLADQRSAVSGVSLDEEATNLIQYQRAYQAAARVIDTVDQLLAIACNLGNN